MNTPIWAFSRFTTPLVAEVFRERVLTCFIEDTVGLELRHHIGIDHIAFALTSALFGATAARLSARILAVEHRLYPFIVRLIAEGRVQILADRVEIANSRAPDRTLLNPQDQADDPLVSIPA